MKKNIGFVFYIIGVVFILNAVFGRYIVLPGYFETLGTGSGREIPTNVPIIKHDLKTKYVILFSVIGFVYIAFAYMEIPIKSSLFFGITGGLTTVFSLILFWLMGNKKYKSGSI